MKIDNSNRVLVTGGAGFIGTTLVEEILKKGAKVCMFDKFYTKNNPKDTRNENLSIIKGDCASKNDLKKIPTDIDLVFHLAADPEVNLGKTNPTSIFQNNIVGTNCLLNFLSKTNYKFFVFTSTSTIYGEAKTFPTPENYSPCNPISLYGASKLACEAMISAHCHTYKKHGIVVRLANIIGPKSDHGIIPDMIKKCQRNYESIEILGDGTQKKSYLHVDDCIEGILTLLNEDKSLYSIFNLGSETQITTNEIVDIILEEFTLQNIKKIFKGIEGGRGWIGDIKIMLLDIAKIKSLGWKPSLDSKEAVTKTVKEIIKQKNLKI